MVSQLQKAKAMEGEAEKENDSATKFRTAEAIRPKLDRATNSRMREEE